MHLTTWLYCLFLQNGKINLQNRYGYNTEFSHMCSNYENCKAIIWLGLLICGSYAHVLSISEKENRVGDKCVSECVVKNVCVSVFPYISLQLLSSL